MYQNAQWIDENGTHIGIRVDINGKTSFVPADPNNGDFAQMMELVDQGKLVIAPAA